MGPRRLIWLVGLLAACTPAPTPLPVQPIRTPTPITAPRAATDLPPLRVGVLANAADFAPLDAMRATGASVAVTDDTAGYDVVVGYGTHDGWEPLPTVTVALLLDTTLPPLDDPTLAAAVWDAVQPGALLAALAIPGAAPRHTPSGNDSRTTLANAGYPAGVTLYGRALPAPGVTQTFEQLAGAGIEVVLVENAAARVHMTLGELDNPDARPLYGLPRGYRAPADLPLTFTADGWPLPTTTTGGNPPP